MQLKTCKSVNTNVEEIKKLIGMNIIIGLIPLPSVYDYWSSSNSRCNAVKSIFRATYDTCILLIILQHMIVMINFLKLDQ